jgi:uncharacterized membrane protein YeaQ/YmgE (transglycosylase-associated protein family)
MLESAAIQALGPQLAPVLGQALSRSDTTSLVGGFVGAAMDFSVNGNTVTTGRAQARGAPIVRTSDPFSAAAGGAAQVANGAASVAADPVLLYAIVGAVVLVAIVARRRK